VSDSMIFLQRCFLCMDSSKMVHCSPKRTPQSCLHASLASCLLIQMCKSGFLSAK
ncbi:hypothetical protein STEG23_019178, partial [Scotinomys teguina]